MRIVHGYAAYVDSSWSATDGVVFVLAAFAASASWQAVLAVGGALVGRVLSGEWRYGSCDSTDTSDDPPCALENGPVNHMPVDHRHRAFGFE